MRIWNKRKWPWYTLYAFLLMVVFLYYRFPSEAFRNYLQTRAEGIAPGVVLSIKEISPSFPPGLRLTQAELSRKEGAEKTLFKADNLIFRPDLWSFLQGQFSYHFKCSAYGGDLEGRIDFTEENLKSPYTVSLVVNKIMIRDNTLLQGALFRHVEGTMEGTVTYDGKSGRPGAGSGQADLRLSQGAIKLSKAEGGAQSISFREFGIKLLLKDQRIELTRAELKGRELQGELSGTLNLGKEFAHSSVMLRGAIEPFPDFLTSSTLTPDTMNLVKQRLKRGKLSFTIRGTVSEPRMTFL